MRIYWTIGCDIYHMVKGEKDMGFAIKQTGFSYPKVPDVEDVACHFNVNANAELTQTESANEFIYSGKITASGRYGRSCQ